MDLSKYKLPEKTKEAPILSFQEYALDIVDKFGVTGIYKQIIFKHAKRNKSYLQGKVALCYEKWGEQGCKDKGRYLISLFRSKKPWEVSK